MDFKLGQTLQDAVTGFTGTAIQRRENLSGNVQYAVQARNKTGENELPDAHFIDHHMLNLVDEGVSARATEATATPIPLGAKVKDRATGLEGIAIARATFINGCVWYDVLPKKKTEMFDANPDPQFIDGTRLEIVKGNALAGPLQRKAEKPPGGPSSKVIRQKVRMS